jgi:eukaryotic-like serine/threonine-protein kinase
VAIADLKDQLQAALGATYTLERELGRGGMATVFLAVDAKHKRRVALKMLHADLAIALGPERFRREIELAAQLQHPHILSVHDSGETPTGLLWFTMPYVEGESLRDRLTRERQLPLEDALRIAGEAARALDYAHRHGVIHRDIKPENILLTKEGDTLVADFGIGRALGSPGVAGRITETGVVVGTPAYMSPEQAAGEREIDGRTDIYSLGTVLYEMLAGEPPFTGGTAQAVIAKRMSGEIPSARRVRPSVPEPVEQSVRKALAPVPADRFSTAGDFARALATSSHTTSAPPPVTVEPPPAQPPPAPPTPPAAAISPPTPARHRRIPPVFAASALSFLVGVGVLFAWRSHSASGTTSGGPVRLAVLPFENEGDSSSAYFADGIADEIRGKLSAVQALRVVARTSSNQYRHTQKPAQDIGRELGVRYLLTGTVQWERSPDGTRRVRVSPELVEVSEGGTPESKWQQSFDAPLTDVFQVQADVAGRVADKLGVVLSPPAQAQLAAKPTQNLAAYDAYLRSTALTGNDPSTLRRSLAYADQAVALDSTFAAAWAQVATLHALLYSNSAPNAADSAAAQRAADRAVALAPQAAEAYEARGYAALIAAQDVPGALTALGTAVRLAPSSASALRRLSNAEAAAGRLDAALAHAKQATSLDPRSTAAALQLVRVLVVLHRYPEASTEDSRALASAPAQLSLIEFGVIARLGQGDLTGAQALLNATPPTLDRGALVAYLSNFYDLYWVLNDADRALVLTLPPSAFDNVRGVWGIVLAQTYWLMGNTARARVYADSARIAFTDQVRETPNDGQLHLFLGLALAYLGHREAALQEEERGLALTRAAANQTNIPYFEHVASRLDLALGERERALDKLEPLMHGQYWLSPAWLKIDPNFAPLHGNPRFERLITGS